MGINSLGERFLHALNSAARTEDDLAALMTLLDELGRDDLSLLFAIRAADRGLYNPDALLPQLDIQPARGLRVDEALVHAIAWQESKFRIGAVSRSGALGLMQVLPATAKAMAERHELPFDEAALTKDARYNLTLGAAYLQDSAAAGSRTPTCLPLPPTTAGRATPGAGCVNSATRVPTPSRRWCGWSPFPLARPATTPVA